MNPLARLLYAEKLSLNDVKLDVGKKVRFDPSVEKEIEERRTKLARNEPLLTYRGFRKEGGIIVIECDIIDYAANLTMLEKIPGLVTPLTIGGVETCRDGVVLGVLDRTYSKGRVNTRPAGFIKYHDKPEEVYATTHFNRELVDETGFRPDEVGDVHFTGIVHDTVNNQIGLSIGLIHEHADLAYLIFRQKSAKDGNEYSELFAIKDRPADISDYIRSSDKPLPMCLGRLTLHALGSLSASNYKSVLSALEGKVTF